MKTNTRLLIRHMDTAEIRSSVLMKCSIKEALFREFSFFAVLFQICCSYFNYIMTATFLSLSKLWKMFIKVVKKSRFAFVRIKKT